MIDSTVAEPTSRTYVHSRLPNVIAVWLGLAGIMISAVSMIALNLLASEQVSPLSSTMSNYVFVDGYGWLFPTAALGMAAGGFAVLLTLLRSALGTGILLRLTVSLASVCCILVAAFPTNRTGPLTLSAEIHRYAAGVAFCCVPIAALLLAARLRGAVPRSSHAARLDRYALASTLILAVFLTSHLGLMPGFMQHLRGLFQRVQFAVQLATLAQFLLLFSPVAKPACLRAVQACWRRARPIHDHGTQTRAHGRQTRPRVGVVDILPASLGWHTVGVWTPMARSLTRSTNGSPPSP